MDNSTSDFIMPWLVFKLKEQVFAIHCSNIETIFQLDNSISQMPDLPSCMRGIINLRGKIVPLLELRNVLGITSYSDEQEDFANMLEQRKHDHIAWVDRLKKILDGDTSLKVETDPHKCDFGKWYDHYKTDNQHIQFQLNKLDEPHKALHQSAIEAFNCNQEHDKCKRSICLKDVVRDKAEKSMHEVVDLIDQTKNVFKENLKEMCVVIVKDNTSLGLIVDEVIAVEDLTIIADKSQFSNIYQTSFVDNVASAPSTDKQVLVLNEEKLFDFLAE